MDFCFPVLQVEELSSTLEILRQHEKPLPPPPPPGADNDEDEHQAGAKAVEEEEEEDVYDETGQNGMHSAGSSPERDTAELERSLSEAESKISELLKIKERYAEVRDELRMSPFQLHTLWCQLEDMFQLIVTPQGI